ncbi:MAG TPA: lysylphosphatidylglycerol synthase transmembrane domain-containing protein [Polyangiaceae bacterium]|nr:lysylphosphatidylglycerol synthase transmembrane domain-containing protein [Polyangiaceae bacterium]
MSRARILRIGLKYVAGPVILACIAFFFYREFEQNWANVRAQHLEFRPGFIAIAVLCMLVAYLTPTLGWQLTINELGGGNKLTFSQTVATVNSSNLVKYVPGKVLTYALQMYWLANRGFSKALVLYVNALSLLVSLAVSLIFGFACVFFVPGFIPPWIALAIVIAGLALDIVGFAYHSAVLGWLVRTYNRVFQREMSHPEPSGALLGKLHAVQLVSCTAFALSAYFTSRGIGYYVPLSGAPRLMAAIVFADTIAFFAVFTPGGLGVREALMYLALGGSKGTSLAITLPIAARVVHMGVDLLLGGIAFRLLSQLTRSTAPAIAESTKPAS